MKLYNEPIINKGGEQMKTDLEAIDSIIERTGASYHQAKEAYEKFEGNTVDAIIYLEGLKNETTENSQSQSQSQANKQTTQDIGQNIKNAGQQVGNLLLKLLKIKVVWKNDKENLLELPAVILVILLTQLFIPTLILSLIPLVFGVKLNLKYGNGIVTQVSDWFKQSN